MGRNKLLIVGIIVLIAIVASIFFIFNRKTEEGQIQMEETSISESEMLQSTPESVMSNKTYQAPPAVLDVSEIEGKKARIKTGKGDIVLELLPEAPLASSNFIFLTNEKFYDGLTFHRREENFVIQGGDPNGNGTGGPGYKFDDETVVGDYERGIVAMANSGPNTNGSQFFIMLANNPLPKNYTIFGRVVYGMDVVDKIQIGDTMSEVTVE